LTAGAAARRVVAVYASPSPKGEDRLESCIAFVSWAQEERKRIQKDRDERVAAAHESFRALVRQERDTLFRLIREVRERRSSQQASDTEETI
jgi:hypothetical protein